MTIRTRKGRLAQINTSRRAAYGYDQRFEMIGSKGMLQAGNHKPTEVVAWNAGNISSDPLFLNAALRDYRLATNSPAAGSGHDGGNMGAHFPVGAPMALSQPRFESETVSNGVATIRFWADSEKSYTLQSGMAVAGGAWTTVTNVATRALPLLVEVTTPVMAGNQFFRLLTP